MATSNSITTTYAGVDAGEIIGAALLAGTTLGNNGITVKPNIKYKQVLRKIALGDLVKDATCDFNATSSVTQTEVTLTPQQFDVNLQLCADDYISDWASAEMSMSEWDELPKTVGDFIIARVMAKVAQKVENTIWTGVGASDGEFDGFETLLTTNADQPAAMEIAGTTLSAANILAQANLVVDQIPNELYANPDLRLYMPLSAYKFYTQALAGFGTSGLGAAGVNNLGTLEKHDMSNLYFNGVQIFVANGMSDDVMICTTKDNLVFGTGLMNDMNMVKVLDMESVDLSSNVRFALRYSGAVQYQFGAEIVTYGIVNGSN
jgi:hypothetical protein